MHVRTITPVIAITFDDGPNPRATPQVLDVLERFGARATFFMIGEVASQHPQLVRMVTEAGHCIGNHGWDHQKFGRLHRWQRWRQMQKTEQVLHPYSKKLFRPPFGDQTIGSRLEAYFFGFEVIGWSAHGYDWCERDPYKICDAMMQRLFPGCIVLLHDGLYEEKQLLSGTECPVDDRKPMLKALELFLHRINGQLSTVTVPQLISMGTPYRQLWFHRA